MVEAGFSSVQHREVKTYIEIIRASYKIKTISTEKSTGHTIIRYSNGFKITLQIVNCPYFNCIYKMVLHDFSLSLRGNFKIFISYL